MLLAILLTGLTLLTGVYEDESGDTLRLMNPPVIEVDAEVVKNDDFEIHEGEVYEVIPEAVVLPEIVDEKSADNESARLWGVATVTFYCSCSRCCGKWSGSPTASGAMPTPNHTVACGALPFGTRLLIDGQEYVVEDKGVNGMWVDIFVASHAEAVEGGMYQTEVYIIE